MQVTLMHNPRAGAQTPSKEELIRELECAGHRVVYQSTADSDFGQALQDLGDLVIIAGGDGTVGKVGRCLVGVPVPIAILPLGRANNIARTLGLTGNLPRMIASLTSRLRARIDIGLASGPWGRVPFFEAVGTGLFSRLIQTRARNKQAGNSDLIDRHGSRDGAIRLLLEALDDFAGDQLAPELDDKPLEGTYLLTEVMNTHSVGPNLILAPEAHPDDGLFDVVLVEERAREELRRHLLDSLQGKKPSIALSVRPARKIAFSPSQAIFHVDDEYWPHTPSSNPEPSAAGASVQIRLLPRALEVLLPADHYLESPKGGL